ncbi:hypothetical protein AMS68_006927 [Peltaster fructicola]|uniref:Phosphatidic acid phosphatase type 2/haloperoxidase domain-containing protein n=1 Tax=Peltaster fructicola TaxID=286661 RepID=A0A6H0Y469_9PEZI|nr:hypothetical protein AMS68_006927 [Peltaster fructicola]
MASPDDRNDARRARLVTQGSLLDTAARFWQRSYAGDYLGLGLLVVAYLLIGLLGEPFHQMFRLNDYRLQHPHAEVERVPVYMLIVYAAVIPAVVLCIWNLLFRLDAHKAHVTILGLAISIITTSFLTDVFKNLIGRPRPDLIARCSPIPATPHDELVTIAVCTETNHHLLHDGWRSFPSGHSSFAFAGLGWLTLFLASQTHCIQPRASLATFLLCVAPLIGAGIIAISRLEDYRHDVGDVLVGSALGLTIAFLTWRRYYPSLYAKDCSEPFLPPRSGRSSPIGGFQRLRDEEEGYLAQRDSISGGEDLERLSSSARPGR